MDQQKISSFKYTELSSLRKIEAEFWIVLLEILEQNARVEDVYLKPLVKMQKSHNNKLMKMIDKITQDCTLLSAAAHVAKTQPLESVDEVDGFVNVVHDNDQQ